MPRSHTQIWLIAVLAGNVALWSLFAWRGRPAQAQVTPKPQVPLPVMPDPLAPASSAPQPIQVQALDGNHFVVVTREPRLTTRAGQDGPWQNMLLTVVTHYTVHDGRLVPVEHVRVPVGFRTLQP